MATQLCTFKLQNVSSNFGRRRYFFPFFIFFIIYYLFILRIFLRHFSCFLFLFIYSRVISTYSFSNSSRKEINHSCIKWIFSNIRAFIYSTIRSLQVAIFDKRNPFAQILNGKYHHTLWATQDKCISSQTYGFFFSSRKALLVNSFYFPLFRIYFYVFNRKTKNFSSILNRKRTRVLIYCRLNTTRRKIYLLRDTEKSCEQSGKMNSTIFYYVR